MDNETRSQTVTYSFTAKGKTPKGNKWRCSGTISHEDGYPMAAFEAVADLVEKQMGVRPNTSESGNVTLRKLTKKGRP